MKYKVIVAFLFLMYSGFAQDPVRQENLQDIIRAYMEYFDEYDPMAPEQIRKAQFNKVIDQENPDLSPEDRQKAFKIVDAYIRADKGLDPGLEISEEDRQTIKELWEDAEKKKETGIQAMLGEVARYQNMSYDEFKQFITQNGQIPYHEADLKKAYNEMHRNDGKQVEITPEDMQEKHQMNELEAVDVIREPDKHTYDEFRTAMKVLKPGLSEEEIQQYWQKLRH